MARSLAHHYRNDGIVEYVCVCMFFSPLHTAPVFCSYSFCLCPGKESRRDRRNGVMVCDASEICRPEYGPVCGGGGGGPAAKGLRDAGRKNRITAPDMAHGTRGTTMHSLRLCRSRFRPGVGPEVSVLVHYPYKACLVGELRADCPTDADSDIYHVDRDRWGE